MKSLLYGPRFSPLTSGHGGQSYAPRQPSPPLLTVTGRGLCFLIRTSIWESSRGITFINNGLGLVLNKEVLRVKFQTMQWARRSQHLGSPYGILCTWAPPLQGSRQPWALSCLSQASAQCYSFPTGGTEATDAPCFSCGWFPWELALNPSCLSPLYG